MVENYISDVIGSFKHMPHVRVLNIYDLYLRHVLVTSCYDTTHSVTFTAPLHQSIYKRSSDWSVDNRSLGHQIVSRTVLR